MKKLLCLLTISLLHCGHAEENSHSSLDILSSQYPNIVKWLVAPLRTAVPSEIEGKLVLLRETILDEGYTLGEDKREAHLHAVKLCESLSYGFTERRKKQVAASLRIAQRTSYAPLHNQALDARRNYLMSWPQYEREVQQRLVLLEYRKDANMVASKKAEQEWFTKSLTLRKNTSSHYQKMRHSMREFGIKIELQEKATPPEFKLPAALKKGMVLWHGFDEKTGTRVADKSGMTNHSTVDKGNWIDTGVIGGGFDAEGALDCSKPFFDPAKQNFELTLCGWFNVKRMVGKANECPLASQYIRKKPNRLIFNVYSWHPAIFKPDSKGLRAESTMTPNTWHFISLTRESNGIMKIYMDGKEVASGTVTGSFLNVPTRFSGNYLMDEIMIWERALSIADIEQLYKLMKQ